jgi:hypothetical protein
MSRPGVYEHYKGPQYRVLFMCPLILPQGFKLSENDDIDICFRDGRIIAVPHEVYQTLLVIDQFVDTKHALWLMSAKNSSNDDSKLKAKTSHQVNVYVSLGDNGEGRISVREVGEFEQFVQVDKNFPTTAPRFKFLHD